MGERSVKVTRLRCNQTDDDDVDEVFMFHNGSRIWPPSGIFSMTQATEVPMDISKDFGADQSMRFSLRDDETFGSDSLGFIDISAFEPLGPHERNFDGGGGSYTLFYRMREISD